MENLIFVLCFVLLMLLIFAAGIRQNRLEDEKCKKMFKDRFGMPVIKRDEALKEKGRHLSPVEDQKAYYRNHRAFANVDDITWNDLDLDRIFQLMDQTGSGAGEEYLYYLLRTPLYSEEELLKRDRQLTALKEDDKSRLDLELLFHKIGKGNHYSLYDHMKALDKARFSPGYVHVLYWTIYVMLIVLSVITPAIGLTALVIWAGYCVAVYMKEKERIKSYLSCFGYILRLLRQGRDVRSLLERKDIFDGAFEEERELLKKALDAFSRFEKGAVLVTSMNSATGRGNPIDMLLDFARMLFHVDLIKADRMLKILRNKEEDLDGLLTVIGKLDAYISLESFREGLPVSCMPIYRDQKEMRIRGLYHPLIADAVPNDFSMEAPFYGTLITGSNASGKSTFLKAMALSLLFGQIFYRTCATCFETMKACVFTSMSLKDSIQEGESYYMAEIRSIKRMLDAGDKLPATPVCFVDEVLRGTNTVERIAASSQILRAFSAMDVPSVVATHDLELAGLLKDVYRNLHFEEKFAGEDVAFSYQLLEGVSDTQNAIRLLKKLGFDERITEKANALADYYRTNSKWPEVEA